MSLTDQVAYLCDAEVTRQMIDRAKLFSETASRIWESKYAADGEETPEETNLRIVRSLWSAKDEDLWTALLNLMNSRVVAFNSPVYFNLGVKENPQLSACFILGVDDTMDSISELASLETSIFRNGSGSGCNYSALRAKNAPLSKGGIASGPVSFMQSLDAMAGAIKSGGKTRRAARIAILDSDHPDILDFINCKVYEEEKLHVLSEAGLLHEDPINNPGAFFQNTNHTVRLTDEDMRRGYLVSDIAEAIWICGDPGVHFTDTVQRAAPADIRHRIRASNPCVTGDTFVSTADGPARIKDIVNSPTSIVGSDGRLHATEGSFPTGRKPVYRLETKYGYSVKVTADHLIYTENRGDVEAQYLTDGDVLSLGHVEFGNESLDPEICEFLGMAVGDGNQNENAVCLTLCSKEIDLADRICHVINKLKKDGPRKAQLSNVIKRDSTLRITTCNKSVWDFVNQYAFMRDGCDNKQFTDNIYRLDSASISGLIRGVFTTDGTVADYGDKSHYVSLDNTSLALLEQIQYLLLGFGIKSKIYKNRTKAGLKLLPDGKGGQKEYHCKVMHSLRISRNSRKVFEKTIGFCRDSYKADQLRQLNATISCYSDKLTDKFKSLELLGYENVYDITEKATSHFVANGLIVHNCSEFLYIDNSACNLASINVAHEFFDVDQAKRLSAVAAVMTYVMDRIVGLSSYPSPAIRENSVKYRPLGLGITGFGEKCMREGIPYGSEDSKSLVGFIMSTIQSTAQSVCPDNYQHTLIAPTGTISLFLDAESTGIEPVYSEETTKYLAGGGFILQSPDCVDIARREYGEDVVKCAVGSNAVTPEEHIEVVAAAQKYCCGSISKTVNLPYDVTPKQIERLIQLGWEKQCKTLSFYRDGSKATQPLVATDSRPKLIEPKQIWVDVPVDVDGDVDDEIEVSPRIRLSSERSAVTKKFSVGGEDGYITVGLYDDGSPGEVFVRVSKVGSTLQGFIDQLGIAWSLALQYGVPLAALVDKAKGTSFAPSGFTGDEIRYASSIVDYLARWLEHKFLDTESVESEQENPEEAYFDEIYDACGCSGPPCTECGSLTQPSGTCYVCLRCGTTTGCG